MATHNPYAVPSTVTQPAGGPAPQLRGPFQPPTIKPRSFPCHTQAVLQQIRGAQQAYAEGDLGWRVLQELWNISPTSLDTTALAYLHQKPRSLQQHVLLTLATTNLRNVKNLSAFVSCLIHELETPPPVCLGFLAGCCLDQAQCPLSHPDIGESWKALWRRWEVSWQDFDYLVLNALCQRDAAKQDEILRHLAGMKLKKIHNLSALLSSVINQYDGKPEAAGKRGKRPPPRMQPRRSPPAPEQVEQKPMRAGLAALEAPRSSKESDSSSTDGDVISSEADTVSRSDTSGTDYQQPLQGMAAAAADGTPVSWADDLEAELVAGLVLSDYDPYPRPTTATPPSCDTHSLRATPPATPTAAAAGLASFLSPVNHTASVIRILQTVSAPAPHGGWEVLRALWNLGPSDLDQAAFRTLRKKPPAVQEQVLLTWAASDLSAIDPAPLLKALIRQQAGQVCWRFLAGTCPGCTACGLQHPPFSPAWGTLFEQWGITYHHLDYKVLSLLWQQPLELQTQLLWALASLDLRRVPDLSGTLLRMLEAR